MLLSFFSRTSFDYRLLLIFSSFSMKCSLENNYKRSQEDGDIQEKGIVLDIVGIISHFIFESILLSPVDLCHAGHSWFYDEYLILIFFIECDFPRLMRTWSDERHVTEEDVPQLREFIDGEFLDPGSYLSFSWIICYLIEWSLSGVSDFLETFFILECTIVLFIDSVGFFDTIFPVHIPEF